MTHPHTSWVACDKRCGPKKHTALELVNYDVANDQEPRPETVGLAIAEMGAEIDRLRRLANDERKEKQRLSAELVTARALVEATLKEWHEDMMLNRHEARAVAMEEGVRRSALREAEEEEEEAIKHKE